jgi:hypothetical protein
MFLVMLDGRVLRLLPTNDAAHVVAEAVVNGRPSTWATIFEFNAEGHVVDRIQVSPDIRSRRTTPTKGGAQFLA